MNRFQKFLKESGIADSHRHSVEERASYFVWYHTTATEQPDADLEIISAYLTESGTTVPNLHELYERLSAPRQLVERAPIPGKLRMKSAALMDEKYKAVVFESKGLAPLYFFRNSYGLIVRIGSVKDKIKYWPQRNWLAAWIMFFFGVVGIVLTLVPFVHSPQSMGTPQAENPR